MHASYRQLLVSALVAVAALVTAPLSAQPAAGRVELIRVPGASLEGNLTGDAATRDVFVYLPPSYSSDSRRRYPVVVFLHGYAATADSYVRTLDLPQAADRAIASGAREMIIVLPDAFTAYSGSMYSNSVTTGDWESYIADDLISHVDAHYRTLASRESRGLAGHSMGGYGTVRIWYEASRCVRRPLCHELMLFANRSRARWRRGHARCARTRGSTRASGGAAAERAARSFGRFR